MSSRASPLIRPIGSTSCCGVIWVYGLGDDGVIAFTDFGIESLIELIKIHKELKSHDER